MGFSENDLIVQAQAGDRHSFDQLVARAYPLVFNTAYRILGDHDSAADATQMSFVRAFRSLRTFRRSSSFTTWLYRIVSNVCLDMVRREKRHAQSLTLDSPEEPLAEREIPDTRALPERTAMDSELQQTVHKALGRLRMEYRTVLIMYDLAGFSYEEIAEMLKLPLGTVKSRLNRARLALREEMEKDLELIG
ncbi:MAG: sigma-70 family RNA polymerase sigma factor [Armatimonadia bacterium]